MEMKKYKVIDVSDADAHSSYKESLIGQIFTGEVEESAVSPSGEWVAADFTACRSFVICEHNQPMLEGAWIYFLAVKVEEVEDEVQN